MRRIIITDILKDLFVWWGKVLLYQVYSKCCTGGYTVSCCNSGLTILSLSQINEQLCFSFSITHGDKCLPFSLIFIVSYSYIYSISYL